MNRMALFALGARACKIVIQTTLSEGQEMKEGEEYYVYNLPMG